ncbi:MAG: hypothetical protein QOK37_1375 [Thermoanaerobaculia bacterium]|jgi:hypothetical protein|nr:hypothetical protein [Thermoanaerobaculia bacterium]
MKPITILVSLVIAAIPLTAGAQQTRADADAKSGVVPHPPTLLSAPQSASVVDSPLVRAAKAAHRPGGIKASTVITNETLLRGAGHFTTTNAQQPLPAVLGPKPQTEVEWLAEMRKKKSDAADAAAASKKADELKKLEAARREQLMEGDSPESILNDPPAATGPIETMKPAAPPETMKPATPPTMETKPPV